MLACHASSGASSLAAELDDREFLSESLTGFELVDGTQIRIRFRDLEFSAHAGCNHLSGTYRIEGDRLHVDGVIVTQIGCDPALHAQDSFVQELLTSAPRLSLSGSRLTMVTDDALLTLIDREVASPDRPLVGTRWVGNGSGNDNGISFGPGSAQVTLELGEDGRVQVFTACQTGAGTFTAGATTLSFEALTYDGAECPNPSLEQVDADVTRVLDGSQVRYQIEEAGLTIQRATFILLFRADE